MSSGVGGVNLWIGGPSSGLFALRGATALGEGASRELPRTFRKDDGVVPIRIQGLLYELRVCATSKRAAHGCHLLDRFAPVYGEPEFPFVFRQNRKANRVDCFERGPLIGLAENARATGKTAPAEPVGRMRMSVDN